MNLHDIGRRSAPEQRLDDWMNQWFSPEAPPSYFWRNVEAVNSTTLTAETLFRAYRDLSVAERPRRAPEQPADAILADIYRFRDRLMMAGLRQREMDRIAFTVTYDEYRRLQEWIPQEGGFRGPTYERDTGRMTVMGVTVLPTR